MSELAGAMALAQLRKLPQIVGAMRTSKWQIRNAIQGIAGLQFRQVIDPEGDTGPFLLIALPSETLAKRFVDALRAEGISGQKGSLACLTMREWGLHWYSNVPSLVERRSNSRDGFPWTHPANAFAQDYNYGFGELPHCDDLHARGVLLTIASKLTPEDVGDIILAVRKVASAVLA